MTAIGVHVANLIRVSCGRVNERLVASAIVVLAALISTAAVSVLLCIVAIAIVVAVVAVIVIAVTILIHWAVSGEVADLIAVMACPLIAASTGRRVLTVLAVVYAVSHLDVRVEAVIHCL